MAALLRSVGAPASKGLGVLLAVVIFLFFFVILTAAGSKLGIMAVFPAWFFYSRFLKEDEAGSISSNSSKTTPIPEMSHVAQSSGEGMDSNSDMKIIRDEIGRYWYGGISYDSQSLAESARAKSLENAEQEKLKALGITLDHAGRYWAKNRPYSSKEKAIEVATETSSASEYVAQASPSASSKKPAVERTDAELAALSSGAVEKISISEMAESLRIVGDLHKDGLLTDEEFLAQKAALLKKIGE